MCKEFELDEDGNVIDKTTLCHVMKTLCNSPCKKKKKTEPKEVFIPKKGVLFIDILEDGCWDCPCCDSEQAYCAVISGRPWCNYKERLPECPIKEITITPEEFAKRMQGIKELYSDFHDTDERHVAMDDLMCELLRELGYGDGIDIFDNTSKWYE